MSYLSLRDTYQKIASCPTVIDGDCPSIAKEALQRHLTMEKSQ